MEATDLSKFLTAQESVYASALAEITSGRKQGHWMWYIFPQISGLGSSSTSIYYAIDSLQQAAEYLHHPVLGKRLIEICEAILAVEGKTAYQILSSPDDLKLKSSMTLFSSVRHADPVFQKVLDKYYNGIADQKTLEIIRKI